jgi:DNA-binding NarL/FixJ family response regulator
LALTEREKEILQLTAGGTSDYRIARKLHCYTNSVMRSRLNAFQKLEQAKADLEFTHHIEVMKNSR